MGLGWANEEESKFLQDFMPRYELCQVKRNYQAFWPLLFAAYQAKFPLTEKLWPNLGMTVESLTDEENEVYTKKLKARHESLKEWFRWRANPRSRNTTTAVTKKDLKSIYQPNRKRGHKSYEIFAKLYPETVDAIVEETCRIQGVSGKAKLPLWHKVVSGLWSKATREQVDAVNAQIEKEAGENEHDDDDNAGLTSSESSPESYQHYLKLLPGILTATVDPAVRKAGVMALCTIIGPVPEADGQIIATTLQFGDSDGTPLFSSVWPGYEEAYVENLARFARKYEFSEELCIRRSLIVKEKEDLEEDETSSPGGSSQSEPTANPAAGSPGSNDPRKEPAHNPHSARTGSLANSATHGASSGDPPPQPSQAGAPNPTPQQLAPVPSPTTGPSKIPIDSPTQNPILSSGVVSTTTQVPEESIELPPIVAQRSVHQQGVSTNAHPSRDNHHSSLPFPPNQTPTSTPGRDASNLDVPPVPQTVPLLEAPHLTLSDPQYGLYPPAQDMLSFENYRYDPNMTDEEFEDLLNTWDERTGRTWGDVLGGGSVPGVDLSSLQTLDSRNWCDINTFNAIAQQGDPTQPTRKPGAHGQSLTEQPAVVPSPQTYPAVQAPPPYSPQAQVNPNMPYPPPNPLHSSVTGAPETLATTSGHSINPSPSSVTSQPNLTEHDATRPSEITTIVSPDRSVVTKSTEADPEGPADTSFMLSMKQGFGSSLFGQLSAQPKEASTTNKGRKAKPTCLRKPCGRPVNKENQEPASQHQPARTTTSPTRSLFTAPRLPAPPHPPPPATTQLLPPPAPHLPPPATPHLPPPATPHLLPPPAPPHPSPPLPPPSIDSSAGLHLPNPTPPNDATITSEDSTTRRSARGTIKNTWLEKQNLIGTNTISHLANTATTARTDGNVEDEGPPQWFTDVVEHFQSYDLGDAWKQVVQQWMALETSLGHGKVAKTPLPVQNRPDEWTKWASKTKHGVRPYDKDPEISDPAEFGLALLKWWYTLQPSFRTSDNNFPRPVFSDPAYVGDPWTTIRKSGPNGFVVFMTLLSWWGRGSSTPSPFKEDSRPAWNLLLQDVRLSLEEMSRTLPQLGEKRRRGQGDDGVQDNKRQKQG